MSSLPPLRRYRSPQSDTTLWFIDDWAVYLSKDKGGWYPRAVQSELIRTMNDDLGLRDVRWPTRTDALKGVLAVFAAANIVPEPDTAPLLCLQRERPGRYRDRQGHWLIVRGTSEWMIIPLSAHAEAAVGAFPWLMRWDRRTTLGTLRRSLAGALTHPVTERALSSRSDSW